MADRGGWEPKTLMDVLRHLEWEWECSAWWPKDNLMLEIHRGDGRPDLVVVRDWSEYEDGTGVMHFGIDDDGLLDHLLRLGKEP